MPPSRSLFAARLAAGLASPAAAQAPDGGPATPPGPLGAAPPVSRTAPGTRVRAVKPDSTLPDARMRPLPKPTAAELAEKRKLDRDLRICIGC